MEILKAENLTKTYGNYKALDEVSISMPEGCIFGLLGPNGAGKTTFIRIVNQIIAADSGEVWFAGQKISPDCVSQIGYLPEERGLYKKMKVGEQAIYLAQLKGLSRHDARQRLQMWFDKFEIGEWWNRNVEDLSKGMQQKVQFIVTVLHRPRLLIFDEPFSGFDPINANLIKQEILQLKADGASIIFSTHNMNSVEELCDNIALINRSKMVLNGETNAVRRQFATNRYKVVFTGYYDKFLTTLTSNFRILEQKQLGNETILTIEIVDEVSSNDVIRHLMNSGTIVEFNRILPSMNDIFISAVNQNLAERNI